GRGDGERGGGGRRGGADEEAPETLELRKVARRALDGHHADGVAGLVVNRSVAALVPDSVATAKQDRCARVTSQRSCDLGAVDLELERAGADGDAGLGVGAQAQLSVQKLDPAGVGARLQLQQLVAHICVGAAYLLPG